MTEGEKMLQELLETPATPEMEALAKRIVEAGRQFDGELDRCLIVTDEILRRRITV